VLVTLEDVRLIAPRVDDLAQTLALERIDSDLFRSTFLQVEDYSLYGGLVAAQALAAAGATVPAGRAPHSLHGYFLRPGDADRPTILHVESDRDGRTVSSRRVTAVQQGKVIFHMAASFGEDVGEAFDQHVDAPAIAAPEELPVHTLHRYPTVEVRAEGPLPVNGLPHRFWVRSRHALPSDDLVHACALTYISDLSTGVRLGPGLAPMASVDHALWVHHIPRVDDWLLVDLVGQVRAGRRGLYTGSIFTSDGRLAATLAQEMLVRRTEVEG
jgi:acyl-CoA thioesterase II